MKKHFKEKGIKMKRQLIFLCFILLCATVSAGTFNEPAYILQQNKYPLIGVIVLLVILFLLSRIRMLSKIRNAQKREIESMEEYMNLVNNMPIVYLKLQMLYDQDHQLTDMLFKVANKGLGKTIPELLDVVGKKVSETILGDSIKEITAYMNMVISKKQTVKFPFYIKEYKTFYEIVISPSNIDDYVDVFCLDTTQLHKTQFQLSSTNEKLAMALDVANIIPCKWDLVKDVIFLDKSKAAGSGNGGKSTHQNIISVTSDDYLDSIHPDDRDKIEKAFEKLISGELETVIEEYRVIIVQNDMQYEEWLEVRAKVEKYNEDGKPISLIGTLVTITARKKMERELISARDHAEESSRLKSAFLANMSHEIRTPLNAIVGFSGILANITEEDERHEYISLIESNSALLLHLISDILDLSKIEAGTLEFYQSDFELNHFMNVLLDSMKLRVGSDKVKLIFDNALPACYVNTEKNRLAQVLTNLISNAMKFTDEGYVKVSYSVKDDNFLYFTVTDTGCGIPAEKQSTIFERFVKLNVFTQGTGLGLPICELIVGKMGGEIGVESELGKGSTFWFTIPYKQGKEVPEDKHFAELLKSVPRDKLTILVAEDHASDYKLYKTILQGEYRVIHAWDGKEAIELFKEYSPHIILMDINMPIMDGFQSAGEIRKLSPKVPIIAITASAYSAEEKKAFENGFNGSIPKPIDADRLKKEIMRLLQKSFTLI